MTEDRTPTPEERAVMAARREMTMDRFRSLRRRRLAWRATAGIGLATAAIVVPLVLVVPGQQTVRLGVTAPTSPTASPAAAVSPSASPSPTVAPTTPPPTVAATTPPPTTSPVAEPSPTASPTTPPRCTEGQFTARTTTDRSTYAPGQTVTITVTQTNTGPTCYGEHPWLCGQPVSVYSADGVDVWDWRAGPTSNGGFMSCPAEPFQSIPHGASATQSVAWQQNKCAYAPRSTLPGSPNPNCPNTQVSSGTYTVVGDGDRTGAANITITG